MAEFTSTDSGATILSKINYILGVTVGTQIGADYVCGGVADDVQIQAAIDYVYGLGGGIVKILAGTYITSDKIYPKDNVQIVGEGEGTIIQLVSSIGAAKHAFYADGISDFSIEDLTVDGNITGNPYDGTGVLSLFGTYFLNCTRFRIDGAKFKNFNSDGIHLRMGNNYGKVKNCTVIDCYENGIYAEKGTNLIIEKNTIIGPAVGAGNGIFISMSQSKTDVLNNIIYGATQTGIYLSKHTSALNPTNINIHGNIVSGCARAGINALNSIDVSITGNQCVDNTQTGVLIQDSGRVVCDSNVITGNIGYGISVGKSATLSTNINVSNNSVFNNGGSGIVVRQGSTYVSINGNQVRLNNTLDADYAEIYSYDADYVNIIGNIVEAGAGNASEVIRCEDNTSTYHNITENIVSGSANAIKIRYYTSVGSKARNNIGFVTENSGTGSIASGATTAVITHGLSVTPTLDDINITFGEQGGNDYGRWWVSNLTSTQFTLNVSADPGASNLDFAWRAVCL